MFYICRGLSVLFLFLASSQIEATQITFSDSKKDVPSLEVWLTENQGQGEVKLPPNQGWLQLRVDRTLFPGREFVYVWKKDGHPWISETKRLSTDISDEQIWLEGGKAWKLEILTLEGQVLATVDLKTQT